MRRGPKIFTLRLRRYARRLKITGPRVVLHANERGWGGCTVAVERWLVLAGVGWRAHAHKLGVGGGGGGGGARGASREFRFGLGLIAGPH